MRAQVPSMHGTCLIFALSLSLSLSLSALSLSLPPSSPH